MNGKKSTMQGMLCIQMGEMLYHHLGRVLSNYLPAWVVNSWETSLASADICC